MGETCATCPFRESGERETLARWTKQSPNEFWPCHEAYELDEFTDQECRGHRIMAKPEVKTERAGLMLCCMRTAGAYGDHFGGKRIPEGTTIICQKCGQKIESLGGQAWKAKSTK